MKVKGFVLYKIYYDDDVVYLGRTKQPLKDRIRGHVFSKPMHRKININQVSKIEYAEFKTEADMNLYEVYYINKLKPPLNVDDKTRDELTVIIPDVKFNLFECTLWDKWKSDINGRVGEWECKIERRQRIPEERTLLRNQLSMQKITREEYDERFEALIQEGKELEEYFYPRRRKSI